MKKSLQQKIFFGFIMACILGVTVWVVLRYGTVDGPSNYRETNNHLVSIVFYPLIALFFGLAAIHAIRRNKRKDKILEEAISLFGERRLKKELGWIPVQFPIIDMGTVWGDPVYIEYFEEYRNRYFAKSVKRFENEYVIEVTGAEYHIKKIPLSTINGFPQQGLEEVTHEKIIKTGKILTLQEVKDKILNSINSNETTIYANYKEKIEKAGSFRKIVSLLKEGIFGVATSID